MRPLPILTPAAFLASLVSAALPGVVYGQVTGGLPLTCSATASTPTLRAEGLTELTGDIVIACTGGPVASPGQPAPQVNLTLSFTTQVTSRLLNGNVSEALLLLDEPNSGLTSPVPGFGPAEPFTVCATPLTGCAAWEQPVTGTDNQPYQVAVNGSNVSATPGNAAPNVYQGVVSGNQVTFYGVPIVPPGPTNGTRIGRITNVRVNATQITGGTVQAFILVSNPSALPTSNPTPNVGFIQSSQVPFASSAQFGACQSQTQQQAAVLSFSESIASAFKTRVDPTIPGQSNGQSSALVQNVPGAIYLGESGFTLPTTGSVPAGLADSDTWLQAVFNNVPPGVRLFVSAFNVTTDSNGGITGQVAQPAANDTTHSFAQLVPGETVPSPILEPSINGVRVFEITPSAGSSTATAVWEVINTNPAALETMRFAVYVSYIGNASVAGTGTVNLNYSPTSNVGTASAYPIPRFLDTSLPVPAINIAPCGSPTLSTLSASPDPAVYGEPVTLIATAPAGTTGSATFFDQPGTPISGAVPLSGNTAQTNVTLPAGSYNLYANIGNSSTSLIPLVVLKASTTTALSVAQDRLTMTATVTAMAPGSGMPAGTVQFVDHSGNIIGSAPLVAGQGGATATLQALAFTGSTAVYSGDVNFNGSSSAPVTLSPPAGGLSCSQNTTDTPILRSEGLTELVGDIVITCTNGISLSPGQPIPQINLTVNLPAPVTSRLLNGNVSEALLMIDEPNFGLSAPVPGFGPAEPLTLCNTPLSGCTAWAQQATGYLNQTYELSVNGPNASAIPANAAPNVFQGVASGNQVTFYGIPALPPGPNGSRVFRITNLRVNATQVTAPPGSLPGSVPAVVASVYPSNWLNLPVTESYSRLNPGSVYSAFVQPSLTTAAAAPQPLSACVAESFQQATVLTYKELLQSAYKTRVDSTFPGQSNGQSASLLQDLPGVIYESESDFTLAIPGSAPAGLADFGTRLKAVFNNVPPGVRLFVSVTNVTTDPTTGLATSAVNGGTSFAQLVSGETAAFSVPTPTAQVPGSNIGVVEITPPQGSTSATAVWEVVSENPVVIDTFQFAVFVSYPAYSTTAGIGTVNLSYAPTSTVGTASASASVPRFLDTSSATPAIQISPCAGTITLTESPNPAVYGQQVIMSGIVPDGIGGTVTLLQDPGTILISGMPVVGGGMSAATWPLSSLPAGVHSLYASFSGNATIAPATSNHISLTVQKAATATTIASAANRESVIATVTVNAPGGGTPTGTVQFFNGATPVGSATLAASGGVVSATLNTFALSSLNAVYLGDTNFTGSTSAPLVPTQRPNLTLASSLNPSILGQAVTFTLTVNSGAAAGTAQFYDGTTLLGNASVSNGQASYTTSALAKGSHAISAMYNSDSASMGQVVNGLAPTVSLTVDNSSPAVGQPVTLTAQLGPAPPAGVAPPSGQVEFRDNGLAVGTATISQGAATLTLNNLSPGQHALMAIYSGDKYWAAGHSAILTVTVALQPTTTILLSSAASTDQAVLAAFVSAAASQTGTPTGTVQFVDTSTKGVVATTALLGGRATLTLPSNEVTVNGAIRSIAAVYSGDAQFAMSTSSPLAPLVNAASYQQLAVAPDEIVTVFVPGATAAAALAGMPAARPITPLAVSGNQINFVVPADVPNGLAAFSVLDAAGSVTVLANLARQAPGIFSANANGQGAAAGNLVRVAASGAQTIQNIAAWNAATNSWAAVPIVPPATNEQLYLILYGTGLRHGSGVQATVNGVAANVVYAGPQGTYSGVDHVNLQLPAGLAGTGEVPVVVTVDGQAANAVTVLFQ